MSSLNFISLCKDLYPTVFSFLLYTESISLQKCSKYSLKQNEKMDKYCQHIFPHRKIETYNKETKLIIKEENYKEGKKDGIQREWYYTGKLYCEYNYKKGEKNGIQQCWYENGQLWYKYNYKNGKLDGIQKEWNENRQLIYENYTK